MDTALEAASPECGAGVGLGCEYLIEARGCRPAALKSRDMLERILNQVVADLGLRPLGHLWHAFPEPGGVTGMLLLSESHLTVHTFPERASAMFNLYCCKPKPEWPWADQLRERLGARHVELRSQRRG